MPETSRNKFVLTGGPGLGKSVLLPGLKAAGFRVFPEAARRIIDDWLAQGAQSPSPFDERRTFDAQITSLMVRDYQLDDDGHPCVYDRGLPDLIGWCYYLKLPCEDYVRRVVEGHPYERLVLITPEWAPWYEQTQDRPFSLIESFRINAEIRRAYTELGYEPVELPRDSVSGRVAFITAAILRYKESEKHR